MAEISIFQHAKDVEHYPAGTIIFHEGEPSHCIYVIRAGQVELSRNNVAIASLGPGKITGVAFISNQPHIATATARTDCSLLAIDEQRWNFLVQQTPHFAAQVMAILVEQLDDFIELLVAQPGCWWNSHLAAEPLSQRAAVDMFNGQ
jgi:CRP/FNR family transcriptional regulator, cyclic AMP receptor protein